MAFAPLDEFFEIGFGEHHARTFAATASVDIA
jgi:hypothetical protein